MQLQGARGPFKSLYLATLGGAQAPSGRQNRQSAAGSDADFLVLGNATPLMSYRLPAIKNIAETLFVLMTLGDDRTFSRPMRRAILVHQR